MGGGRWALGGGRWTVAVGDGRLTAQCPSAAVPWLCDGHCASSLHSRHDRRGGPLQCCTATQCTVQPPPLYTWQRANSTRQTALELETGPALRGPPGQVITSLAAHQMAPMFLSACTERITADEPRIPGWSNPGGQARGVRRRRDSSVCLVGDWLV